MPKPLIEFICDPMDLGVIAAPVQAKSVIREWFRELPPVDRDYVTDFCPGLTVKRCMPFVDALTTGWIVPLAVTVRLDISNAGRSVIADWEDKRRVVVSGHEPWQMAGNPHEPRRPCKFHNYWTIKTPPGWSCLVVPPLNRRQSVVDVLSGVVDTDVYQAPINIPFIPIAPDGSYTLERGTPLVQVIPFARETTYINADVRAETAKESALRQHIFRNTQACDDWYRRETCANRSHAREPLRWWQHLISS